MPCDLNYGSDQRQVLAAVSSVLDSHFPLARLRNQNPDDLAPLAELGVFNLTRSVEERGAGFSLVEEALVHKLLGRRVVSTKAFATTLARRLAAGQRCDKTVQEMAATACCVGVRSDADVLLIEPAGVKFAVVFDPAIVVLAEITEDSAPRAGLGGSTEVLSVRRAALAELCGDAPDHRRISDLLACAQLVGIAEATCDLAVAYAQVRHQFGRPIGYFQAIKHHCANMAVMAEMASAQLDMAAIAERDNRVDAAFQVAALVRLAGHAALGNARTCIQIHGGIGFSAEIEAHRFLKQAHVLRNLLSDTSLLDLPAPLAPFTPPRGPPERIGAATD